MSITVRYFAWVRERIGRSEDVLELPQGVGSVKELLSWLRARKGTEVLGEPSVRMAVNGELAKTETPVSDGDEVAFFPPVTGG